MTCLPLNLTESRVYFEYKIMGYFVTTYYITFHPLIPWYRMRTSSSHRINEVLYVNLPFLFAYLWFWVYTKFKKQKHPLTTLFSRTTKISPPLFMLAYLNMNSPCLETGTQLKNISTFSGTIWLRSSIVSMVFRYGT